MKSNPISWFLRDEGDLIAMFGDARLVKRLNGKFELLGGIRDVARTALDAGNRPLIELNAISAYRFRLFVLRKWRVMEHPLLADSLARHILELRFFQATVNIA